jgi:hypothetical protein
VWARFYSKGVMGFGSQYPFELLAIYLAIKHFRYFIEGREFTIFTDHKPLTTALYTKMERSPRQVNHLDFISQFTSDIRYIQGKDNVVADYLSRPTENEISTAKSEPIDLKSLAKLQLDDEELKSLLVERKERKSSKYQLQKFSFPEYELYFETSTNNNRLYIPESFRRTLFNNLHKILAFPIPDSSTKTIAKVFLEKYISRFGVPLEITTDRGSQFESKLFKDLIEITVTHHVKTTAYHPQANGMDERFHRQLKAALEARQNTINWSQELPFVLLGIRTHQREPWMFLGRTSIWPKHSASGGISNTIRPYGRLRRSPECVTKHDENCNTDRH